MGGKPLAEVPTGEWVHIEIRAGLGDQSTGVWELTLTVSGKAPQTFAALPCDPKWKKLDWLGFVSNADRKTVFYLDNLLLENRLPR